MVLEFSNNEIVDVLEKLGYEVHESKITGELGARRKMWNKREKYYVIVNNEKKTIDEVFKKEIIKSILK